MVNEFVKPDKAVRRSEIPHADIFQPRHGPYVRGQV